MITENNETENIHIIMWFDQAKSSLRKTKLTKSWLDFFLKKKHINIEVKKTGNITDVASIKIRAHY